MQIYHFYGIASKEINKEIIGLFGFILFLSCEIESSYPVFYTLIGFYKSRRLFCTRIQDQIRLYSSNRWPALL